MKIFISCSSQDGVNEVYKEGAKNIAELLAKDNDLVFGASNKGLMGIVYQEFKKQNRHITGICYEMYKDLLDDLELDEVMITKTLGDTIRTLVDNSDAMVFLPGSYGTLAELIVTLELKRTNIHNKPIIIYNNNHYFDGILSNIHTSYLDGCTTTDYDDLCQVLHDEESVLSTLNEL